MVIDTALHSPARKFLPFFLFALAASGLYASSLYSFLLFHSLIEVLCVVVLLTIFVLVWNARTILDNHYFLLLGISFLFTAAFTLIHTFAYKGFEVFPGENTNLSSQLWIASRYLFSLTFLIAPVFITRRLNAAATLIVFAVLTALLCAALFFGVFPDCFIEGQGLTPFKVYSEYIIIVILMAALGLLISKRTLFDPRVLRMLAFSIVSAAAADAAFTQYLSAYGPANLIGHFFLFLSAILIYRAIVVTAITEPMAILYRNLEQSREQFKLIAETSVDLIFQLDAACKVMFCSPAVVRYGYSVADVIGKDFSEFIAHDDLNQAVSAFRRAIGGRGINALELRLLRADGTLSHAEINVAPLMVNGAVIGLQGVSRDVTNRKKTDEALRESDQFNKLVLDTVGNLIVVLDIDGRIRRFNKACEKVTGYTAAEVRGRVFLHFMVPEEDMESVRLTWEHLQAGDFPNSHENHWIAKNGTRRLISWTNTALVRNGKVVYVVSAGIDITDRKLIEQKLRESEALYRRIGESIDYGVWVCAPDGRNTFASESFLKMVGITQEQCSNFGWGNVLHPDDADRTIAAWQECVRTGGTWDVEHRFRGTDDQWHHVLARGVPVRNEQGEITCWAGINLDISRLKQAEEQIKASLAEKEVMLREIHHRVKNNLQVISSLVSLQTDNLADERIREEFNDVRDRVRAMALVHEKLYQTDNLAQLNFAEYIASLLHFLWRSHGALAEKVRLLLAVEPVTLPIETAVPCGLILNELVGNALKHAFPDGNGGEVTVGLDHDPVTETVCLRVCDNGVGLRAGLDWRQARSLGLRLVRILAGQLHGTAETGKGPGTEFKVTFSLNRMRS